MIPKKLYIQNFMCYDKAYIDFTQFSSALIVGKLDNSDLHSNGVGKTTIFKAIEYVLFNQADVNLEHILRDETDLCRVVFDFEINEQEYRLSRIRTKKGNSDLSLYQRNSNEGKFEEVYHTETPELLFQEILTDEKYWKAISSRRTSDTEKDLAKLIKVNYKSFRVYVHFMQNDFSGLTTSTPEKRKTLLKDALNLVVYSKLEKIAKDKYGVLTKEAERYHGMVQALGDPLNEIPTLQNKIKEIDLDLINKNLDISKLNNFYAVQNNELSVFANKANNLENKSSELILKEKNAVSALHNLERSIKEYSEKKSKTIEYAKQIIANIESLTASKKELELINFDEINLLNEALITKKEKIAELNLTIKNNQLYYDELIIPLPNDSLCKHCRQELTEEHRKICQEQINNEIQKCKEIISSSKKSISNYNNEINELQNTITALTNKKNNLGNLISQITLKNNELVEKRAFYKELETLLKKFNADLTSKNQEIEHIKAEIKKSSVDEIQLIKESIQSVKYAIEETKKNINALTKEITHQTNQKAILEHDIDQRYKNQEKKQELLKTIEKFDAKLKTYPSVIQGFSSVGIPNLIIQNVLDDLQIEANQLLNQLKPGLQLSFAIEKTNGNGIEEETLGINYFLQNKERYYEQLSGAQKLAVTFSLKLGLSFLLQKMIGVDIKLLLLDEIDQSLDKASIDAFSDIVKYFQKDFKILVITHNDRLKDRFTNGILVQQNENLVSTARVVSSW